MENFKGTGILINSILNTVTNLINSILNTKIKGIVSFILKCLLHICKLWGRLIQQHFVQGSCGAGNNLLAGKAKFHLTLLRGIFVLS